MSSPSILHSPPVLALLAALVEEKVGLHYGPTEQDLLRDKIVAHAADAGFDSLLDYYYFLRYDPGGAAALDALVDALVVGETYFFREIEPLQAVLREIVRPACAAGGRPRVWSAACATGEEPLSFAMLLAAEGLLDRVEIVASDVSARALSRARAGRFGCRALREHAAIPPGARPYLSTDGGTVAVSEEIFRAVDFRRVNLLDRAAVAALGKFDVILCRNVLIYFEDDTSRAITASLAGALAPSGALLVGVSESLMRLGTALGCEERGGAFLYRKLVAA